MEKAIQVHCIIYVQEETPYIVLIRLILNLHKAQL